MIAIIGAGASGLVAAIVAARSGAKVVLYEKNSKFGRKILATGNGRCNISNQSISKNNYHSIKPSFVNVAINTFDVSACKRFFEELGLELSQGKKGRLYPMNQQSSSVVSMLVHECECLGVKMLKNHCVEKIEAQGDNFCLHVDKKKALYKKVLIATGGLAMPTLGSSDSGYFFAKEFGHSIVPLRASLVQLVSREDLKALAGVKQEALVTLFVDGEQEAQSQDDLLFTNYGISGSAILDVSNAVTLALKNNQKVSLILDLFPDFSKEQLKNILKKRLQFCKDKTVSFWLEGLIHSKLAPFIIKKAQLSKKVTLAKELNTKDLTKLVFAIKNLSINIIDSKGFKSAEVTAGGVHVEEIDAHSMESKLQKGLFFSGEVIDIDGDCGGYNLHWAWASGYVAGKAMTSL